MIPYLEPFDDEDDDWAARLMPPRTKVEDLWAPPAQTPARPAPVPGGVLKGDWGRG